MKALKHLNGYNQKWYTKDFVHDESMQPLFNILKYQCLLVVELERPNISSKIYLFNYFLK